MTVLLRLKNPYEPLFSDKCLLWLASVFAADGFPVRAVKDSVVPSPDELLLTNLPTGRLPSGAGAALVLTSPTDLTNRIMLLLGKLYGRTRYYHPESQAGAGPVIRRAIRLLKQPFRGTPADSQSIQGGTNPDEKPVIPEGRRLVFRVNVDWDGPGLDRLESICGRFKIRPTLAVAGREVIEHRARMRAFVELYDADLASHSYSHYVVLSSRGRKVQEREIRDNHAFLEDLCARPVSGFVAPYLKYDRTTFELLEEQGYRWFVRSYALHPLPLAGFGLLDLGLNFFSPDWEREMIRRIACSDLVIQLHLRDLVSRGDELEAMLTEMRSRGVRIIDCGTYYSETLAGGLVG